MSVFKRTSLCALAVLGVSLTILTDSAPAASEAPNAWQLLAGCAEKVQELEAEVEVLRRQLREQRQDRAHRRSPGGRLSQDESRGLATQGDCDVPFEISPGGIKRFKEHCVHALELASCEVPYSLDARGVKNFNRACVQSR